MAQFRVIGAVAVVRGENKTERYLYRGAVFADDGLDSENVKHLLAIKLIEKVKAEAKSEPYKGVSAADVKAELEKRNADRADADKIVPAGTTRDEIVAALVADDAKQ